MKKNINKKTIGAIFGIAAGIGATACGAKAVYDGCRKMAADKAEADTTAETNEEFEDLE